MTDTYGLTITAIDKAFQAQIGKLYDVLTAASAEDTKSGVAIERFTKGWQRALAVREAALKAVAA